MTTVALVAVSVCVWLLGWVQPAEAGKQWAVVIGISDYTQETPLKFAASDAKEVGLMLSKYGYEVTPLYNAEATRAAILRQLYSELPKKVSKDDDVIVYFSGHGVTWNEAGEPVGYLLPIEGSRKEPFASGVNMSEVRQALTSLSAKHVFVMVDACYSGLVGASQFKSGILDPDTENEVAALRAQPGKQVLTAGGAGQEALEISYWKHGLFTHYLLQGLGKDFLADTNNNQVVNVHELFEYVRPKVVREASDLGQTNPQKPELWNLTAERGELVFINPYPKIPEPGQETRPTSASTPKASSSAIDVDRLAFLEQRFAQLERESNLISTRQGQDGAPMVLVQEGPFLMGSNDRQPDEQPIHEVYLDAYYIDTFEVTTSRFETFRSATSRDEPEYWRWEGFLGMGKSVAHEVVPNKPVVGVSWEDAMAYCEYYGKRLPTEAEWEKAARGTDGRRYPWGREVPTPKYANIDVDNERPWDDFDNYSALTTVGSFPAGVSPYGVEDMAGNVWEWVADLYAENYYARSAQKNPMGPISGEFRVIRGGSWGDGSTLIRSASRGKLYSKNWNYNLGFRCVQDAP